MLLKDILKLSKATGNYRRYKLMQSFLKFLKLPFKFCFVEPFWLKISESGSTARKDTGFISQGKCKLPELKFLADASHAALKFIKW